MKMLLKAFIVCALLGGAALLALGLYAWRQFGAAPSENELQSYRHLPYFQNGKFVGRTDTKVYPDKMPGGKTAMLKFFFGPSGAPEKPLPSEKLTAQSFAPAPQELAVYWLGHSSLIIELAGKRILIDPVFGNAAPVPGFVRRYGPSPLNRADIPPADYVLITHNHYDHLEAATLRALKNRDAVFIVPLGVGAALRSWGIPARKIRELAWNESWQDGPVKITAAETGHYSNRRPGDKNKTLWAAYVLQGGGKKLYVSGDTGYDADLYRQTGRTYGPFDVAFIEIDAWNGGWPGIHLFPEQAVQLARDIGAGEMFPVHWGVFNLGQHPWDESIRRVSALARQSGLRMATPLMGQKYVPGKTPTEPWWEKL